MTSRTDWFMDTRKKECIKCHRVLLLNEFYKHPEMADGCYKKCKDCIKQDRWDYRHITHIEKIRERERERRKRRTPQEITAYNEANKKYAEKHPGRKHVNALVNNAIKTGKIIKPDVCQICSRSNPVSHHHDYNRSFDVVWICDSCHRKIHVQIKKCELPPIIERVSHVKIAPGKANFVVQYGIDGNQIGELKSARDAERNTNVGRNVIGQCCLGKRKTAGGFVWKFKKLNNKK